MTEVPGNDPSVAEARRRYPSGLIQAERGARFSMDGPMLAAFAASRFSDGRGIGLKNPLRRQAFGIDRASFAVMDIGCGCGACLAGFLCLRGDAKGMGIDREAAHVEAARANARLLGLEDRMVFETLDAADLAQVERPYCDIALTNPPYWEAGRGRRSQRELDDLARRSLDANRAFFAAARAVLVHHGTLYVVFPARRVCELSAVLHATHFGVRAMRYVRPHKDRPASRVLVEAQKEAAHDVVVLPDLVLYAREGRTADERVVTPQAHALCPWLR